MTNYETYEAYNGMRFDQDQMRDLVEETLQYMKKEYRTDWLEAYPEIKRKDGFFTVEDMSDKEVYQIFEEMVDGDTIDLAEDFIDESTSIYGGW